MQSRAKGRAEGVGGLMDTVTHGIVGALIGKAFFAGDPRRDCAVLARAAVHTRARRGDFCDTRRHLPGH